MKWITNQAVGATMPNLNTSILRSVPLRFPPLPTQRKIAAILSAYDDLIENNLQRIKILEEMAQNLYREWFVKFRFPGHEKARFADSSFGRVPEGWEVIKVSSLLEAIKRKKKIKKQAYKHEGEIPIVDQGKDFIGGFTSDSEVLHEKPLPIIVFGDHTRILKFIDFPFASGADGTQLLRSNTTKMPMSLFFYMLKSIDLSNYTYARHFKFLKDQEVLLPTQKTAEAFSDFADPFREQIRSLTQQNVLLRRTRDLLLPKLISGEIDVSNLAIQIAWLPKNKNDISRYDFFQRICRLPFVDKIVLFGSRARGDHHDRSDIDLAVFCDQASDKEWQQVLDCLREDRIDTLLKVDCVRFERSNAALKEHIMIEGKVLYEKNGQQTIEQLKKRKEQIKKMSENKLANHLSNSQRCLKRLDEAVRQPLDEDMFMLDAVVHRFNVAFELLMDTLLVYCVETDFLPEEKIKEYELNARKLIELAFDCKLIDDDQTWIAIKDARNATAHEYDEQQALDHYNKVKSYLPHLQALFEKMNTIHSATPADDVAKDVSYSSKNLDADN